MKTLTAGGENTVATRVFASCTLGDHRRGLTVTTDYGTDPLAGQTPGRAGNLTFYWLRLVRVNSLDVPDGPAVLVVSGGV
ncbi:hypothetical protein ACFC09_44425 [Streptomyces sp. NPDC056161]|uniref:hypothetical protein n=1 Tax=Streptomyces sp. NPDC056161 TaxID=3345732 RepID=UPI0035DDDDBA